MSRVALKALMVAHRLPESRDLGLKGRGGETEGGGQSGQPDGGVRGGGRWGNGGQHLALLLALLPGCVARLTLFLKYVNLYW